MYVHRSCTPLEDDPMCSTYQGRYCAAGAENCLYPDHNQNKIPFGRPSDKYLPHQETMYMRSDSDGLSAGGSNPSSQLKVPFAERFKSSHPLGEDIVKIIPPMAGGTCQPPSESIERSKDLKELCRTIFSELNSILRVASPRFRKRVSIEDRGSSYEDRASSYNDPYKAERTFEKMTHTHQDFTGEAASPLRFFSSLFQELFLGLKKFQHRLQLPNAHENLQRELDKLKCYPELIKKKMSDGAFKEVGNKLGEVVERTRAFLIDLISAREKLRKCRIVFVASASLYGISLLTKQPFFSTITKICTLASLIILLGYYIARFFIEDDLRNNLWQRISQSRGTCVQKGLIEGS